MEKKTLTKEEKEFIKLSETIVPKTQKWRNEEKDAKLTTKEYIQVIKDQNVQLRIELGRYMQNTQSIIDNAISQRIIEKNQYLAIVENECDKKVANKELIITGLRQEIAKLQEDAKLQKKQTFRDYLKSIFGK